MLRLSSSAWTIVACWMLSSSGSSAFRPALPITSSASTTNRTGKAAPSSNPLASLGMLNHNVWKLVSSRSLLRCWNSDSAIDQVCETAFLKLQRQSFTPRAEPNEPNLWWVSKSLVWHLTSITYSCFYWALLVLVALHYIEALWALCPVILSILSPGQASLNISASSVPVKSLKLASVAIWPGPAWAHSYAHAVCVFRSVNVLCATCYMPRIA